MYSRVGRCYGSLTNTCRWKSSYPSHLNNTPITRVSTLPSGLRVASGVGNGDVATIGVWFNVGSGRETEANCGVNNFYHKLVLSGGSRDRLVNDIESIAANLTGYSDRESTAFYGQAHKSDTEKFVKILSEALQSNNFKTEDVESVRQRIINVHRQKRGAFNSDIITDHIHAAAYQGSSHAYATIGEPEVVKKLTVDNIVQFRNQFYSAHNLVLVGTGAVKHEELEQLASRAFGQLSATPISPFSRVDYVGSEIRIRDDTVHDVKVAVAWEAVGRSDPHYWAYLVLNALVGQWRNDAEIATFSSSRWAEQLSLHNLVTSYHSHYKPYNATGLFEIYFETVPQKQEDATYIFLNEFQKLATYVTPEELNRAKNQLKVALLSKQENPVQLAQLVGESVLACNRPVSTAEYFQRIEEVSVGDVQSVLSNFFTDVDPVLVAYGPIEEFPDYNIVRGWTYWNRW